MANVKRRLRSLKSKKKKTDARTTTKAFKSDADKAIHNDSRIVKKRPANDNLLFLTPDEKVTLLLQNGDKLKDSFNIKPSIKPGQPKDIKNKNISSPKVAKRPIECDLPGPMKTKSGRIRDRRYKNKYLKIVDNILQNELCVVPGNKRKRSTNSAESKTNGVNNNNDSELTNQNNKTVSQSNIITRQNSKDDSVTTPDTAVSKNVTKTSRYNKKNPLLVDEPKSPPKTSRGKGRLKKDDIDKSNETKTKEVEIANGVVLTLALYECDYCSKTFSRKHSLVRHIYLHLGWKPHSCPVCPKKFRIFKNMKNHIDRDHCVQHVDDTTETFSCQLCDKPFLTKDSLTLHLQSHIKGENTFKCIYCDKKFAYQLLLIQHEKKHLVTGKYQCTLCEMKYNSRDKLYVHVKSHLKLTDYICQYCGREFLRANSMKRHVQTMHVGRTIQCPICNKKLKGHLTEHIRTHDKKRPHECPDCGKHFAQSTQLKVHRRGHTGFRPYLCRICDRPFTHSNALMLHLRRHTGEKPFPCAECPMSFSQLPHMKAHMSKIHGKEKPYKCLKCYDYFKLKKDLLYHKKNCMGTGTDTNLYGDLEMNDENSQHMEEIAPMESTMSLSRMRFLLALLFTMIATKEKLKYLGFNKRLVDDLLVESLEAMDQTPCKDESLSPLMRLKTNIEKLLKGTVPKEQMEKFKRENKSTEELLELLTSEKEK